MLTKNIETMKAETAAHIAADAVQAGHYWRRANNAVGGTGCFIACLTHGSDASDVESRFGMPEPLVRIAEHIFERLPKRERRPFFAAIPEAIGRDGRDLTLCHWAFLADTLRHLPPQEGEVEEAIDRVIAGMDLLAAGKEWPDADAARAAAARAAVYAAAEAAAEAAVYAARGAAAEAAAEAAYAAAEAAYAAEIERQRDSFLRIIREA